MKDWVLHSYLTFLGIIITAILLLVWINCKIQRRYQFVPGPIGLPVLGNLYIFYWYRSAHQKLAELAEIYGPVFSLKLGFSNVLVLSSIDSVKEALIQRGSDFSGRPSFDCLSSYRFGTTPFAYLTFCPTYLRNKQAMTAAINISLYNSRMYELRVTSTAQQLVKNFLEFQGTYFDPQPLIKSAVAELMFKILFGDELPLQFVLRAKYLAMDFPYQDAFAVENFFDSLFLPKLFLVDRIRRRTDSCYDELLQFIRDVNRERNLRTTRELPQSHCMCVACVLQDSRSRRNSLPLSEDKELEHQELDNKTIDHLLVEMFMLGCGKISAAIAWMLVFIGRDRNLQQHLHDELNKKPSSSYFSLADKTHLLLLEATILEVFRMFCPFPFAIPHSTIRETAVAGFKIPKNTPVFINLWACCRDSKYYRDSNAFNPFRFLDDKKEQIDKLLSVPSFSVGERRCFGYGLAKGILFLVTSNLLNNFQIELDEDISVKENATFSPRKFQLRACAH